MAKVTVSGLHLDKQTGALTTIEYAHHEIHAGDSFSCHYEQAVSDTNDMSVITLKTPDTTKWIHMFFEAQSTAESQLYIWESPTLLTSSGTNLTIYNRDRNSSETSGVLSTKDATANSVTYYSITDDTAVTAGTQIYHEHLGAGDKNKAAAGASRGVAEWILAQNTVYGFALKSYDANDNVHSLNLDWYEHTNLEGGT